MFEETEWDSNEADESLAKTLFLAYPKVKQKKKKTKVKKKEVDVGTGLKDEITPSDRSHGSGMKDEITSSNRSHGKVMGSKTNEKSDIISNPKKKRKENSVRGSVNKKQAKQKDTLNFKRGATQSNEHGEEKLKQRMTDRSIEKMVKEENLTKPLTSGAMKKSKHKERKTSGASAKLEDTATLGKQKNKYKSVIGDKKCVGQDVKVVKPVLDIPRKLKLAGVKASTISQAQVQAVISEMSTERCKLKRKRKPQTHECEAKDELDNGLPQQKKRKQLKSAEVNASEFEKEKCRHDKGKFSNSDFKSFMTHDKIKGNRKKMSEESDLEETDLMPKRKKASSTKVKEVSCKEHQSSGKSLPKHRDSINRNFGKSPLSVSKLKSILAEDKESSKHLELSVSDELEQSTEKSGPGKVKKRQKSDEVKSLKDKLQDKLMSSRFRYLNEQLYTCTGEEALDLFSQDVDAFYFYHQGFQSQVAKWPKNPVDRVIEYLKERPARLVVADFGCGEAKVAQSVKNQVHSFDLVKVNEYVIVCDIKKVPLGPGSIDVAVFCLSLMGTNFTDFLCEASRVLKTGGILLIAEVTSRFDRPTRFARKVEKLGFALENQDQSNKMFIWFEFKKTGNIPAEERMPKLELAPCYYKRR